MTLTQVVELVYVSLPIYIFVTISVYGRIWTVTYLHYNMVGYGGCEGLNNTYPVQMCQWLTHIFF